MEHGHKTCRFNQLHEEKNVLLTSKGKQITLGCYEIESYIKDRYCWSINTISNKVILFALLVCTYVTCLIFTCRRSDFFIISTKICLKKIGSWHIFCLQLFVYSCYVNKFDTVFQIIKSTTFSKVFGKKIRDFLRWKKIDFLSTA